MKSLYKWSRDLQAHKAIVKFLENKIPKITELEFGSLINYFWLEWACREEMSPCGHLTITGKLEYLENNKDVMQKIIDEK